MRRCRSFTLSSSYAHKRQVHVCFRHRASLPFHSTDGCFRRDPWRRPTTASPPTTRSAVHACRHVVVRAGGVASAHAQHAATAVDAAWHVAVRLPALARRTADRVARGLGTGRDGRPVSPAPVCGLTRVHGPPAGTLWGLWRRGDVGRRRDRVAWETQGRPGAATSIVINERPWHTRHHSHQRPSLTHAS